MSGKLLKDAAYNQANMVWEVEEGNASVVEWWGADERGKNGILAKNTEKEQCL